MAQRGATLGLLLLLFFTGVACDSAGEGEGCADGSDPSACLRSSFAAQDSRAREVSGIVRRGEDGVEGAFVRIDPSAASLGTTFSATTSTDAVGFYRVPGPVGSFFDLGFALPGGPGGRTDVLVFRDVSYRYMEPQLDPPTSSLPRSWLGHVLVTLDAPLPAGHKVLFLASGDGVYGVTGDLAAGIDVHTARYSQSANIRAIEYDEAKGLISASAYGKADVVSDAGRSTTLMLHLDPITLSQTPVFTIDLPPGFVPGDVQIRFGSSRTSDAFLTSIPWGQSAALPIVPDQGYTYRLRATRADGAVSDSGEQAFAVSAPALISLPAPPEPVTPDAEASVGAGDPLAASGTGILEHVLEPEAAGAPGIRVVGTSAVTTIPDLASLAVSGGTGRYVWTVRRFSTLTTVEGIWGADARRSRPVAISAPRRLVLR